MTRGKLRPSTFGVVLVALVGAVLGGLLVPYVKTASTISRTTTVDGALVAGVGSQAGAATGGATTGSDGGAATGGGATAGGDGQAGTGSGAAGTAAGGAGANGPGVTDSEIRLGIGILDIGAAKDLGFNFDIGDQQSRYNRADRGPEREGWHQRSADRPQLPRGQRDR